MYFLGTSEIPEYATAPGLAEAREQLRVASLSPEERHAYYNHLENMTSARNVLETAFDEGLDKGLEIGLEKGIEKGRAECIEKGRAEGIEKGKAEERLSIIRAMLSQDLPKEVVANIVGISTAELDSLII